VPVSSAAPAPAANRAGRQSHALVVLRKPNFDALQLRSKSWDEFAAPDAPKLDFVFTVCDDAAKEVCPIWPGQPMTAHWGLPDPAKAEGTEAEQTLAFADCFRMLYQRISIFVSLPFDCLSKLSLQTELDQIGKTRAAAAKEPISPALATPGHRAERSAPPRVDKDRRPSYVSRAAASLAFWSLSAGFMRGRQEWEHDTSIRCFRPPKQKPPLN
jgi:protein-tyrosine-phosphatase